MNKNATIVTFDARSLLAAGEEPLPAIIAAAAHVEEGGILELVAPFEPVPLYRVFALQGFAHDTERRTDDEWVVRFHKLGITLESTVAEVSALYPSTSRVLLEHGLDVCCGGGKSLSAAASAHRLSSYDLLAQLHAAALAGQ